jgi:hypothetical protein
VSYILDALKKAAEQRDAHAPAMRRLLSPAPVLTDSPRWRIAAVGGAGAVVAIALTSWVLWPSAPVVVVMETPTSSTARVQPETPAVRPPAPPAPPIVRTTPSKSEPPAKTVDERPPVMETPRRRVEAAPPRPQPTAAPPSVIATLRPAPPEVRGPGADVAPAPRPAPVVVVTPPPTTAAGAARAAPSVPMRLEVIVYSEERARRLAFINGRKYVEGDLVLDSARIQEIQPDSVVIVEDGRRVVLRP